MPLPGVERNTWQGLEDQQWNADQDPHFSQTKWKCSGDLHSSNVKREQKYSNLKISQTVELKYSHHRLW